MTPEDNNKTLFINIFNTIFNLSFSNLLLYVLSDNNKINNIKKVFKCSNKNLSIFFR